MGITKRRRLAILLAYSLQGCSGFTSYPSYLSLFISGNNSFKHLCTSPKPDTRDGGRRRTLICLSNHESSTTERTNPMPFRTYNSQQRSIWKTIQLVTVSFLTAVTLIAWEDLSNVHPMRSYLSSSKPFFGSTVRGLAFGSNERQMVPSDVESASMQIIPSYNEVMLRHRTRRVPTWKNAVTHQDVASATRTLQLALLHIIKCQHLSNDYGWEELSAALREPIVTSQLDEACDVLNRASEYLSLEARSEIGFDFGSCAWRHCGAFADVREAIDELDHLVGVLEPFEANFVLDVAERGLRDMLAVTKEFHDPSIPIPDYQVLQRRSDTSTVGDDPLDVDYLDALKFLKGIEATTN